MRRDRNFKGSDSSDPSVYFLFCDPINGSSFCAVRSACRYISQSKWLHLYNFLITGTLVSQAIIQVVLSVSNNNNLPQRNTQSKQPDLPISLEPRGAIHLNGEPASEIVDLPTPLDIDIDQL